MLRVRFRQTVKLHRKTLWGCIHDREAMLGARKALLRSGTVRLNQAHAADLGTARTLNHRVKALAVNVFLMVVVPRQV